MRPTTGLVRRVSGMLAIAAIGTACATIMGLEEPNRAVPDGGTVTVDGTVDGGGPTTDGGEACVGLDCPCETERDCRPPYTKCIDRKCVECTAAADECPAGRHCLPSNECAPGCKASSECEQLSPSAPRCNVARHQCVQCLGDADCTDGKKCSPAGSCVEGCTRAGTCPNGGTCCGGFCVDTATDVLNCSACGLACSTANGAPSCAQSVCSWACNPGYAHCGTGNTGCETQTSTSVQNCGACSNDCSATVANATAACVASACTYTTCNAGFGDCDAQKANGCECACPVGCSSCAGGVCLIECDGNKCTSGVSCPPGMPCLVRCNKKDSCAGDIVCAGGQKCTVECYGASPACNGLNIKADNSRLCLVCSGDGACNSITCTEPPGAGNDCKKVCGASSCNSTCGNCGNVAACP